MTRDRAPGILHAEKDSGRFDPTLIRTFIEKIRQEESGTVALGGGGPRA